MTYDRHLAEVYDLLYEAGGNGKDYAAEADAIAGLIRDRCPDARSLLDAACGTGTHLTRFATLFDHVEGADLSADMLERARTKLPDTVPVHQADMRTLDLGRTFDAVVCLFSSIGYMQSETELHEAIARFAAHTAPGGVVLIEPWFTPQQWTPGTVHRTAAEHEGEHIVRLAHSTTSGAHSVMDMHYLHGHPDTGIHHWTDQHRLTLFTIEQYEHALHAAGLTGVQWLPGWRAGRDRLIAAKPHTVQ